MRFLFFFIYFISFGISWKISFIISHFGHLFKWKSSYEENLCDYRIMDFYSLFTIWLVLVTLLQIKLCLSTQYGPLVNYFVTFWLCRLALFSYENFKTKEKKIFEIENVNEILFEISIEGGCFVNFFCSNGFLPSNVNCRLNASKLRNSLCFFLSIRFISSITYLLFINSINCLKKNYYYYNVIIIIIIILLSLLLNVISYFNFNQNYLFHSLI